MFTLALRLMLLVGSLLTIGFMLFRIRSSQVSIRDCVFWILFAFCLLAIGIFPELPSWASRLLGFESPVNFVYLFVIFILVIRAFSASLRISQLDTRVLQLTQRIALNEKKLEEKQVSANEKNSRGRPSASHK